MPASGELAFDQQSVGSAFAIPPLPDAQLPSPSQGSFVGAGVHDLDTIDEE